MEKRAAPAPNPRPGLTEGGVMLSGRVLEAGGGPIPGARISARTFRSAAGENVVFGVECEASGTYRLRVPPGRYLVEAAAGGYTRAHAFLELRADEARDFRLEPGAHIDGRVVMAGDQPVPDAQVMAAPEHFGDGRAEYGPVLTDAAGAFRIDELPPGSYRLAARKEGLVGAVDRPIAVTSAGSASGVVIRVAPSAVVTGTVKTQAGTPIAGAEVAFVPQQSALISLAHQMATTDREGRYRVDGLGPGEYRVRAQANGHTRDEDDLMISGPTTHDFVLGDGAVVTVLVLDGSERPVAGAIVRIQTQPDFASRSGFDLDEGVTNAQGRFTSKALQGAQMTVVASTKVGLGKAGPEPLPPGSAPREVTVRLAPGASVSGIVSWNDGKPAPGVMLQAQRRDGDDAPGIARSGPRGEFTLGPFSAGEVELSLRAPGDVGPSFDDGPLHGEVTLAEGEQRTGVKLILSRKTASIAGVVLGPDQRPLAGVVVGAAREGDEGALIFGHPESRAVTGGDGAFVVEGLPPGTLNVLVTDPRYPPLLRPGVPAGTRDLRLRLQRGATLEGVVITAQGAPITSYHINVTPHERNRESVRTAWLAGPREPLAVEDRAGAFRLEPLAAGSYDVIAFTADGKAAVLQGVVVVDGEHKKGLRLVTDDRYTIPGGGKKLGLRATMFGASPE